MFEAIYKTPINQNEELLFQLPEWIATVPFEEFLGMTIEEACNGKAVLTMPFKAALCQGKGFLIQVYPNGTFLTGWISSVSSLSLPLAMLLLCQFLTMTV